MKLPVIVAPGGDEQKLQYAFDYGADEVYVGTSAFSLRSKTSKMQQEEIIRGKAYADKVGKRINVAINIYPRNNKIDAFIKHVKWLRDEIKPHAVIVADAGVISIVKEVWPEARMHLSVQANNVNWKSVEFWHKQGIKRVILSRELTLEEIREIKEKVPTVEIEVFVHGAICVAYSGRCLLSNYMCYRDPNQGACAQACRFQYKLLEEPNELGVLEDLTDKHMVLEEKLRPGEYMPITEDEHGTYVMNARDMCLLPYLKELVDIGVDGIKIEGRSKTVYYAASVVRLYRQALNDLAAGRDFDESLMEEAYKVSSRGYTPGFIFGDLKEYSMRYEANSAIGKAKFIGIVGEEVAPGEYLVEVKNRLEVGSEIEVVMPDGIVATKVTAFRKGDEEVETVHGGAGERVFVMEGKGLSGGLVRVRLEDLET